MADVALQLGRSPGTVRDWIRRGELEAYQLGKEYCITPVALTNFRAQQTNGPRKPLPLEATPSRPSDLSAWRRLRKRK